jgi:preprotein translocase subunit SecG
MTTLHTLVLIVHVLVGAMIVGLVLVQRGRGAETGAAFGSGASMTVFGAKGSANFLSRSTAILATLFFATSLGLAYLGSQRPAVKSVVDQQGEPATMQVVPSEQAAPSDEGAATLPGEQPIPPAVPPAGGTPPAETDR